ncbi:hypothetical protein [Jiella sonneratiae]|uniref:Uncharacterized protein n=1 Tax=Jiella sonneratiae TaxID=2816856 RepID=A0ABS3JA52_9HYPH|nr:hypothetical protein [Jiella sonneratiae]MBO0906553.1 hypothetical protein [Jiella sonneratiae]
MALAVTDFSLDENGLSGLFDGLFVSQGTDGSSWLEGMAFSVAGFAGLRAGHLAWTFGLLPGRGC